MDASATEGVGAMRGVVVCGIDRSAGAHAALRFGSTLAEQLGARLVAVHALASADEPPVELAASERLGCLQVRCGRGSPAAVLARVARDEEAELLVVGNRGRGNVRAAVLGTVSGELASNAPCPVAIVPRRAPLAPVAPTATIVCGVDESDGGRAALAVADDLAARLWARLVLVHVQPSLRLPGVSTVPGAVDELRRIEQAEGEALIERLAADHWTASHAEARVAFGEAGGALLEVAAAEGADLLVVGTRGHGAVKRALLGSVSARVASAGGCPVVVAPPAAARALA
jgi:nucleotide-binding universal stress UspA family protein